MQLYILECPFQYLNEWGNEMDKKNIWMNNKTQINKQKNEWINKLVNEFIKTQLL